MGKKGWLSAFKRAVILSYAKDNEGKRIHRSNSRKSRHANQMMNLDTCSPQTEANPPMAMEVDQDLTQPQDHHIDQPSSIADAAVMADEPEDLKQPDDEQVMQHEDVAHDATAMEEEPTDLKQPDDVQIMQPDSTTDATVEEPADVTQVDDEQIMQPDSIADHDATAMEEEPTTPPADDVDDEVVPTTTRLPGKSTEEIAAIKIQTAYRGHMARKDWRVLRARRRLRVMIKGQAVKRQTAATIMCMQTMARVQSQVRSRTIQMAQVNKDLQRQLLQKTKKQHLDHVKSSEKPAWDLSPRSKEQVEASLRKKREAAERREKALALINTHQQIWRNSLKTANPTSTEPWGWSWLDRWNAVRPWEPATTNSESAGTKSVSSRSPTRSPSKATTSVLKSASSRGSLYSMQSIKGSPNESLRSTSVAKSSTKSTKVGPKISTQAPSRLVPEKKGGSSSKLGVRSIKKQSSLSGSTSVSRRSTVPRRTITI